MPLNNQGGLMLYPGLSLFAKLKIKLPNYKLVLLYGFDDEGRELSMGITEQSKLFIHIDTGYNFGDVISEDVIGDIGEEIIVGFSVDKMGNAIFSVDGKVMFGDNNTDHYPEGYNYFDDSEQIIHGLDSFTIGYDGIQSIIADVYDFVLYSRSKPVQFHKEVGYLL
jgi:hypothetical protein